MLPFLTGSINKRSSGFIFSGDMTNFRKLSKVEGISKKSKSSGEKGHVGHIFALALSSDSKYLVIC